MNRVNRSGHLEKFLDNLNLELQVVIPLNSKIPNGQYKLPGYKDQCCQRRKYRRFPHQYLSSRDLHPDLDRAKLHMMPYFVNIMFEGYRSFRTRHFHK